MSKVVTSIQGDTVDLICWRHYGATSGLVETVLEANPGLADKGAVLPFGTTVTLPDKSAVDMPTATTVSLWD